MQISVIDLLVPTEIQVENVSDTVSKVTLEPLERGFGHTLGNALRRILLSSMPGAAVTDVVIDGISHEYSTIEGVREDVIDILLNLKDMPVKLIEGNEAELKLSVDGPCEVTSSSFEAPGNVELTDGETVSELQIELHRDPENCSGVNYSLLYNGSELTKDLEFKFRFDPAITAQNGDTLQLDLSVIAKAIEDASSAGQLNNEQISNFLQANTIGTGQKL